MNLMNCIKKIPSHNGGLFCSAYFDSRQRTCDRSLRDFGYALRRHHRLGEGKVSRQHEIIVALDITYMSIFIFVSFVSTCCFVDFINLIINLTNIECLLINIQKDLLVLDLGSRSLDLFYILSYYINWIKTVLINILQMFLVPPFSTLFLKSEQVVK